MHHKQDYKWKCFFVWIFAKYSFQIIIFLWNGISVLSTGRYSLKINEMWKDKKKKKSFHYLLNGYE